MAAYNFTHRGKNVSVEIDFYDNRVQWYLRFYDNDGLLNEFQVIGYPNVPGEQIEVTYCFNLIRPSNGETLKSYQDTYYEPNLEAFYRMQLPAGVEYGQFAGLQVINGLVARLPVFDSSKDKAATGYRIFNQLGQFYQPIVFDVNIEHETFTLSEGEEVNSADGQLTVSVVDGIAPYEYQLEKAGQILTAYQVENIFSNLSADLYTVSVRDAAGTIRYAQVEIRREFFEEIPQ